MMILVPYIALTARVVTAWPESWITVLATNGPDMLSTRLRFRRGRFMTTMAEAPQTKHFTHKSIKSGSDDNRRSDRGKPSISLCVKPLKTKENCSFPEGRKRTAHERSYGESCYPQTMLYTTNSLKATQSAVTRVPMDSPVASNGYRTHDSPRGRRCSRSPSRSRSRFVNFPKNSFSRSRSRRYRSRSGSRDYSRRSPGYGYRSSNRRSCRVEGRISNPDQHRLLTLAARHRKGATAERFFITRQLHLDHYSCKCSTAAFVTLMSVQMSPMSLGCVAVSQPSCFLRVAWRFLGPRENAKPSRCLGVFGLSLHTQERDLYDIFSRYGPIDDVQLVYDNYTGLWFLPYGLSFRSVQGVRFCLLQSLVGRESGQI
ncbi:transformer-2 protein homolog alpha [Clonorchis sinensis]|uniref:Transformer-2 protein homolog alpha n=1 Tax=Clonorchis sinensis TaxID=79923 RepID=G7YR09_CLOSI|nr:transformer-2 protein homolog alpha [Clonorchis sinensis]